MTKQKSTKRALLLSALSLLMCVSMLIGSTFAWFTDSVTSGSNKIVAGTLDIDLYKINDPLGMVMGTAGAVEEITDSSAPLFGEDIRWEPAYEAVANLKLENNGNLALKWQAIVRPVADIGELAEVIDVYVSEDELVYTPNGRDTYHQGNLTKVGTLRDVMNGKALLSGTMEKQGNVEFFSIVLKMQETAGNEYQGKSAGAFDITILATQYTYENDSFDNQYDKDSVYGDVMVSSDAELKAAIEDPAMKVIAVNGDLTYDWGSESYENSKALNMKGKTFLGANDVASITFAGYGSANPIVNATFKDITIKDITKGDNESSWEHGYLEFKNLTAVNVTFANSIMMEGDFATFKNCSFNSNKDGEYAVWVANGDATFEGCTFTGPRGVKVHEAYSSEVGTVVIDNNTFAGLTQKPGVAIGTVNADTTVAIKDSKFVGCQAGDQGLYIYETDTDVTTFNFVDENNTVTTPVATFAELKKVFEKGGSVELTADIAITELVTIPAGVEVYLDMNGKTITPASADVDPLFDVKPGAALVIDGNGTFDLGKIGTVKGMSLMYPRGDVTINSGTFKIATNGTKYGSMFVGISGGQGKLIINGGYFDGGYYKEGDCFNNCRNLINGSWGQYIRIYGGTFVGQNPAWGDEGMAFLCPHCTHTPGQGYCQALFLEGQSREDTELPKGYTITEGTTADGRPTYTVNYSK